MGMHEGVMAAAIGWPDLHQALERHCGAISRQQPVGAADWLKLPQGEDVFHVTTSARRAYVLDGAMVLTSSPDLPMTLARELGCTIVSLGAETVSGTYWLFAADPGQLRRFHWNVRSTLMQPLDLGDPLASETRIPLEDVDGKGLFACLAELGFDPSIVTRPVEGGERYEWSGLNLPEKGSLAKDVAAHHKRYARDVKDDWTKHIKPVPRADGGFDLQYQPPTERKSILRRVFGR